MHAHIIIQYSTNATHALTQQPCRVRTVQYIRTSYKVHTCTHGTYVHMYVCNVVSYGTLHHIYSMHVHHTIHTHTHTHRHTHARMHTGARTHLISTMGANSRHVSAGNPWMLGKSVVFLQHKVMR